MKTVATDVVLWVNDVSLKIKKSQIIRNVSFSTCSGDLLAVMGPSGSGKTSLMNVIAGRQPITSGEITLSGVTFGKRLRRGLGFVMQQDVFFSNLTLWETLYFTAMIRLPVSVGREEKLARIDEIIDMFDIRKCLNTAIGDMFNRGLSGGEKKRASIACELLTDPDILILDEPTSGLDSAIALTIVKQLKTFAANYNKTIIITIHQPSSQIYHMFDSLVLLTEGQVAYSGKAHGDPLVFFKQFGYCCDSLYNPADFMLQIMREDQPKLEEVVTAQKARSLSTVASDKKTPGTQRGQVNMAFECEVPPNIELKTAGSNSNGTLPIVDDIEMATVNSSSEKQKWPTGFGTQFHMLTWRNFKQLKGSILNVYELLGTAFIAVVCAVLYFQIPNGPTVFRDRMGHVTFCVAHWTFVPAFHALLLFPPERAVVSKDRAAGAYRLSAYYLAKTCSELPLTIIVPTLFYVFVYWMSGLNGVEEFFMTWPIFMLSVFNARGLGLLVGATFTNLKLSATVNENVILSSFVLSGFFTQEFPYWFNWARYVSIIQYPASAMTIITMRGMEPLSCSDASKTDFPKCTTNGTAFLTSEDILLEAGIELPVYFYICILAIMTFTFRLLAYVSLRLIRHVPN